MPTSANASPLEIAWTAIVALGLLAHLVALVLALGDQRALQRSGLNGARQVVARGAVVHSVARLLISLAFLLAGWIALMTPPRPHSDLDDAYALVALGLLVGSVVLTLAALYDLRERVLLRRALAQRRAAIDPNLDGLVALDVNGRIVEFSAGATRLWGWSRAEIVGQPATLLMPPRFRDAHTAGINRYLRTGQSVLLGKPVRLTLLRKDRTERVVAITITASDGPDGIRFLAVVREADE